MKIAVIALYYSKNLGDAVIGDCVKAKLQEAFPGAQIEIRDLFGRNRFSERKNVSMKDVRKTKAREKLRFFATRFSPVDKEWDHEIYVIKKRIPEYRTWFSEGYDAVVFAGGQIFADTLAVETAYLTKGFAKRGIPVFFNAAGTGSAYCRRITRYLSGALHETNVREITVRDHPEQVEKTYRVQAAQIWDPALWAPEIYGSRSVDQRMAVALGMMYPYSLPEGKTKRFWLRMIRCLDQHRIPWMAFNNGAEMDEAFAKDILDCAASFSPGAERKRLPSPDTPQQLAGQISGFQSMISFRLHSHILAAAYDVPAAAVVWDDKVRAFYHMCGHPERCFTIDDSPETILRGLHRARREGWPAEKIRKGREDSMGLLTSSIRENCP